jgi:hypothetical protein
MPFRKYPIFISIVLGVLIIISLVLLWPADQVSAQCGSQASSCKNCHETQGQKPVNNDGTTWHTEHQQIDACVSCHAGNPQSSDKDQSHAGMVPWNSDVKAGCSSCHPNDYQQKAQIYATTLGVSLDSNGAALTTSSPQPTPTSQATSAAVIAPAGEMVVSQPGIVDYVQQYNETVLGQRSINWGNIFVGVMIGLLLIGGGAFVYLNERRLRGLPGFFPQVTAHKTPAAIDIPVVEGYSTEVTALLPLIAQLNPVGLHGLKRILQNPDQANEMLHSLSHIEPELVRRVQALDKDSQAMLLALARH